MVVNPALKAPQVSILMPFKNSSRYLGECLSSICNQNFDSWELLAIDDHSSDTSPAILTEWAEQDSRIRVFPNRGSGIIPALKTAYSLSRGKLITRMDSDDRMAAGRLREMATQLEASGSGHIALGLVEYFSHRGISNGYARYERWLNNLTLLGSNFKEIYKECVIPSPCWMVYRQDLDACGAFAPDRYPEDYDLCFRFYAKGLTCLPSSRVLHYWRDYDERTSRTSEHYAQNYFLDLKLDYFLKLDRDASRPLVIWGAGYKGKHLARTLVEKGLHFHWLCDNPKKIGKSIYGIRLSHFKVLKTIEAPQSLITVANEASQAQIRNFLFNRCMGSEKDTFFFC
ncbi:glycosyltransferase family 2 protein [Robiginitalea sp.]|uniref:glycosyltransferase family 2 protein n=1 Tax=Robiginitalea sp. TaxID=1902411 RepID=UPI003C745556